MVKKKLVLSFPPRLTQQPVTYELIRKFDLQVNILPAQAGKQGRAGLMQLE